MGKFTNQTEQKTRVLTKISIALNIVFICGAIIMGTVFAKKKYFRKPHSVSNYTYRDNAVYTSFTTVYPLYCRPKKIVMLGNSLTQFVNWAELLNRPDIANRGIGGDITAGYIGRLNYIIHAKPKICFIEGGVNDINRGVHQDTIIKNLKSIIDTLQRNGIKPVLTTVTLLTEQYKTKNPVEQNKKIIELNRQIFQLVKDKSVKLIDLNPYVSDKNFLLSDYAVEDGLHFTGKTYLIWKRAIEKILEQEGI